MTVGFDGSIKIDTRIDTKGLGQGVKAISSSIGGLLNIVKGLGKALIGAFIGGSIISAIAGIIGSFDLMSSSAGETFKTLSDSFSVLKGTFVNLLITALLPLIPYIVMVVEWLTAMLSTVAQIVAALFGFKQTVGSVMSSAASGAKKSAKEARGALAAFDQINVLNTPENADANAGDAGSVTPPPITIPDSLLDKVKEFKEKALKFLQPLFDAFERIKNSPLWKTIGDALKWVWENILVPIGKWFVEKLLPKFLEYVATAMDVVNTALIALKPVWDWLWENVLKPAGEFVGDALLDWYDLLIEGLKNLQVWIQNNQEAFQAIIIVLAAVGLILFFVLNPIWLIVVAIIAIIAAILNWAAVWEFIKTTAESTMQAIKKIIAEQSFAFDNAMEPLRDGVDSVLTAIKDKFISIFTSIKDFIKGTINSIIDYINGMIQSVVGGINSVIGSYNSVGGIIPNFEPILTISAPQIPHLATGAVIPPNSEFMAVLGDQRSGRNIEAPESLIRQIVREEVGSMNANVRIEFGGSLGELVRQLKPYIDKENVRVGGNLIRRTVSV